MQLTYRGDRYQLKPLGARSGGYRGVPWQRRFPKPALQERSHV